MHLFVLMAATGLLIWNASPLLVAVLRISYGKFTWALLGRLLLALAAAAAVRAAGEHMWAWPWWWQKSAVPLLVVASLGIPFLTEALRNRRR